MHVKFAVNCLQIAADRGTGQTESFRYFLVAISAGNIPQHLGFPLRENLIGFCSWRLMAKRLDYLPRDIGGHRRTTAVDVVNSLENLIRRSAFEQITVCSHLERVKDPITVVVYG